MNQSIKILWISTSSLKPLPAMTHKFKSNPGYIDHKEIIMNNKLQTNQIYNKIEQLKEPEHSVALNKLTTKSNNIKAMMKFKYSICKLERTCTFNKFQSIV